MKNFCLNTLFSAPETGFFRLRAERTSPSPQKFPLQNEQNRGQRRSWSGRKRRKSGQNFRVDLLLNLHHDIRQRACFCSIGKMAIQALRQTRPVPCGERLNLFSKDSFETPEGLFHPTPFLEHIAFHPLLSQYHTAAVSLDVCSPPVPAKETTFSTSHSSRPIAVLSYPGK